jgi:CRP/FNR family transcriptional regulator, cyclic AMP receptor protein
MPGYLPDVLREGGPPLGGRRPEQSPRRTLRRSAVALAGVPMFGGFSPKHLNRLAAETDELDLPAGHTIVREGDPGETLFVVLEGQARVIRAGKRVGRVLPGDFFGELSALDGGPRTASVVAETPVRVLRLFRRTLMRLIADEPQVRMKLLDGIVRRLREVDRVTNR